MTNEIQKQYDRLDDVPSIMLHMKEVYAIPGRHIRYAATKAFFRTKMAEWSSMQSHGVKMLSLVEKLEDLKAELENDTYIDATTHKFEPAVLVGEASTSKAKGKRAGCWKRKKGKGKVVIATASVGGAPVASTGKGKGKVGGSQRSRTNDVCIHCQGKGHWKRECPQLLSNLGMFVVEVNMISNAVSWVLDTGCGAHICNNLQVLERSRKLSKDEIILRLGDGKTVAAETVGSLSLVISDHVCGPLNTPARGGFSYFITFTDGHSRWLCLPDEWTPPGTPQLNGVAERRNRTLLDMVRSMMSFTKLPPSFWGYALETAAKLLNIASSKMIPQTPYEIWHGKPTSYKYLRVGVRTSRARVELDQKFELELEKWRLELELD
ncbi:UNVERIFIED_CONTAM: hypothetical protein Slati_1409000 [Sesamum latifolium]|uniref:Gag-pol polyprotein n=1 Tax=Sesamum latifolium TaxID=2727402 RepID=A0AAW2X8Q3_9LAMI